MRQHLVRAGAGTAGTLIGLAGFWWLWGLFESQVTQATLDGLADADAFIVMVTVCGFTMAATTGWVFEKAASYASERALRPRRPPE